MAAKVKQLVFKDDHVVMVAEDPKDKDATLTVRFDGPRAEWVRRGIQDRLDYAIDEDHNPEVRERLDLEIAPFSMLLFEVQRRFLHTVLIAIDYNNKLDFFIAGGVITAQGMLHQTMNMIDHGAIQTFENGTVLGPHNPHDEDDD